MIRRVAELCGSLGVLAALAFLCAPSAVAQSTTASLAGKVLGPNGVAIPDAAVQAMSAETGVVRLEVSDELGRYRIDLLTPGKWTVIARVPTGETTKSHVVTLSLQQVLELDLHLGDGLVETVTVSAEAPLVDARRVGGELRIDGGQSDALPIAGRSVTELASLNSSVQTSAGGSLYGERGSVFVLNGQTGRSNGFLVDGLDNNDQSSGTTLNSFFSQQVIKEFVVLTSQYSPEFGRASGGVMNIITHQGSNEFQGEVFLQGTAQNWNEAGPLVENLPAGDNDQSTPSRLSLGFRLGGALKKDKSFYFIAFEHQSMDEVAVYSGVDRDGVIGGWTIAPNRSDNLFLRTDYNLGPKDFLMVRLSADVRESDDMLVGGRYTPEAGFRLAEQDIQLGATWKRIISSDVMNEVRLLIGLSEFDQNANSVRPGVSRPSGVFGGNTLNSQLREEDRIQLVDNITWNTGDHTVKFGLDILQSRTDLAAGFNPTGNFLYTTDQPFEPGDCGGFRPSQVDPNDPWAPVPCGRPGIDDDGDGTLDEPGYWKTYPQVYTFIFGAPKAILEDTRFGLFAQDTWRISPKFKIDYGLRYDLSTFRLPETATVESEIPNGGADLDWNNIAPRFGFTWTPGASGRTVIRGGAGVFYDKLVLGFPAVAAITSDTYIGMLFPQATPATPITEDVIEEFIAENGYDAFREILDCCLEFLPELTMRFSTGTELETPYAIQANVGFEQAVGARGAVEVNFIRSQGYNLPLMRDLNPVVAVDPPCVDSEGQPDPTNLFCPGTVPVHRDRTVGSISAIVTEGRSWYSALETSWRWRGRNSWYSASYTLSKAEDMGPDPLTGGIYLPPDSDNLSGERGRSDHDRRHRLVLAGEIPTGIWGIRMSSVIQLSSAAPFNVTTGRDENRDGITTDRPEGVNRNDGENASLDAINAVREAEGLEPYTSELRAPNFAQVDLRVFKRFLHTGGQGSGEFYLQVFNLLNRFNGGMVDGNALSVNFGRAVAYAGPPRTVEVGMKFGF